MQLTRYSIAGNKFLPSMTCPDKYFLCSSFREITTDVSPDFDFPCTKHKYKALELTHHYTEAKATQSYSSVTDRWKNIISQIISEVRKSIHVQIKPVSESPGHDAEKFNQIWFTCE
jgi:hypothetical protein